MRLPCALLALLLVVAATAAAGLSVGDDPGLEHPFIPTVGLLLAPPEPRVPTADYVGASQFRPRDCAANDVVCEASNIVMKRVFELQYPKQCEDPSTKYALCYPLRSWGFGSEIHHALWCLSMGYRTNRTVVFKSIGVFNKADDCADPAAKGRWECYFQPPSWCQEPGATVEEREKRVIYQPYITDVNDARVMVLDRSLELGTQATWVPEEIAELFKTRLPQPEEGYPESGATGEAALPPFNAAAWFKGQMAWFLGRLNARMRKEVEKIQSEIGFRTPAIGVHVRRSDKVEGAHKEADPVDLEEYMEKVRDYAVSVGLLPRRRKLSLAPRAAASVNESHALSPEELERVLASATSSNSSVTKSSTKTTTTAKETEPPTAGMDTKGASSSEYSSADHTDNKKSPAPSGSSTGSAATKSSDSNSKSSSHRSSSSSSSEKTVKSDRAAKSSPRFLELPPPDAAASTSWSSGLASREDRMAAKIARALRKSLGSRSRPLVFIATDSTDVIEEARQRWGHEMDIVAHPKAAKLNGETLSRYTYAGMVSVLADVDMLSRCDFFVGTFSSNLGRWVFELMLYYQHDKAMSRAVSVEGDWKYEF